jgi:hypothetical protein
VKTSNQTTRSGDKPLPTRIVRDETCPACGWGETFAEVDLTKETPGADAYGCSKCGWRYEGPAAPSPIYYEPEHDEDTAAAVRMAFAKRGYIVTTDEDEFDQYSITVAADGTLTVNDGDWGAVLEPVGDYPTVSEYVAAVADWFEADDADVADGPAEPYAAQKAERAAWIAGMRALLDILEAEPDIRLPRIAKDPVAFYVGQPLQSARIAKHLDGWEIHDRPERIFRYETTGRLHGLDVAVYVGDMTGVSE